MALPEPDPRVEVVDLAAEVDLDATVLMPRLA
jgi:hypothetical protein